ncbi:hypothetical protein K474DRAFT_692907 [Panus rudis PR-1116 ss-1]|nr:hypothetical protein K474DRAFT_692907 [Panus rudis PR-1116 ss-1]
MLFDSIGRPKTAPPFGSKTTHVMPLPLSTSGGARFLEQQAAAQGRMGSHLPYNYSPPAIIYAPSSKHSRMHYAPPAIIYSPPGSARHAAPSMGHSQSTPVPVSRGPMMHSSVPPSGPHRSHHSHHSHSHRSHSRAGTSHSSVIREEPGESPNRSRSRGRPRDPSQPSRSHHSRSRSRKSGGRRGDVDFEDSDAESCSSGGTYYILPTPGQKVHIIVSPPNPSLRTATSTTKSAHSPHEPKKPFFQRIFHIPRLTPSVSSVGSKGSGRRLQRRHTIGGAQLQRELAR